MKVKLFKNLCGIAVLVLLAGAAVAQTTNATHAAGPSHSHKSHNGGTVKSAGDYHIELTDKNNVYLIYLLDAAENAINIKDVTGLAILRDGDRTVHTQNLTPTFNSHFVVPISNITHTAVILNFVVNNQNITAKFDKRNSSAMNFFCPQKCNGSDSNIAGNCSKCGTALAYRKLIAKE